MGSQSKISSSTHTNPNLSFPRKRESIAASGDEARNRDVSEIWIPAYAGMTKTSGFSLVELSIVLVILGLLAGGVLTGQSLIRAAELRSVTTEFSKYQSAINTFRDKYFALPGDMANATSFWGAANAALATCVVTAATSTATCNGNGDGQINIGTTPVANNDYEDFRAWQHLANAGLIEGNFTGVQASANIYHAIIGTNIPPSKLTPSGWYLHYIPPYTGNAAFYDGNYGNTLYFGGNVTNSFNYSPVMKPEELWNIDTKIDDGKPAYGSVRAFKSSVAASCTTTDVSSTASYDLTQTSKTCPALFGTGS